MKIYKKITPVLACILLLTGCNDWFDVTSSNEIREKDHYATVNGFKQSLIGCYLLMGESNLYGKNISWFLSDYIANQTRAISTINSNAYTEYQFQTHDYTGLYARPVCNTIWSSLYNVIVNANEALKEIDEKQSSIDSLYYHVIKGELLAVRALMHFDLLRFYGYGNWAGRKAELDAKATIPYVTTVDKNITPQASGAEVIDDLVQDLTDAAALLKDYDPVCGVHDGSYYSGYNDDGFFNNRNARLNYYAVEALLAQVYMWEGSSDSKTRALAICNELIEKMGNGYTVDLNDRQYTYVLNLSNASTITVRNSSLINESLFALDVNDLSSKMNTYIVPAFVATDYNAIYLTESQMKSLYDDETTTDDESTLDIRATVLLSPNTTVGYTGYVPIKLYQGNLSGDLFYGNRIPVIRLPEVYYMAAECYVSQGNTDEALRLLNHIRESRGLYTPLTGLTADQVQAEIGKEYRKEFLGEGEIFFYYKRTGATSIPNFQDMTDSDYLLPYPDIETSSGRVQ